ncbi:hypothetical protein RI543_003589 [Arxiozyma heterogenica]|uniref:Uncharacterized protein n=1 Tax=Arxiozyma heterogenica TaxID=278026 RepID=A0AAN7WG82_9SACH|nr:hypothetical protein RI543_003589 [Kazachstania heterogenica]
MKSDDIMEEKKNRILEQSIIKNTTRDNEICKNETDRVNTNHTKCKGNQMEGIEKNKSISQIPSSKSSSREYIISYPKNKIEKPGFSPGLNKIHKPSKTSAKKKHKNVNKVTKVITHKSDSFYTGAIVGSFLGAVISSAITKFLTETT